MTPLRWWFACKSKWLARQDVALRAQYQPQLDALASAYAAKAAALEQQTQAVNDQLRAVETLQAKVADQTPLLEDRQVRVAQANEEARTQLRLAEAKATPDAVWIQAFSLGYAKAWDTMQPIMQRGLEQTLERVRTEAIETTLKNLHPVKPVHELLLKWRDLEAKRDTAAPADQLRYTHYLEALGWALNGHRLHPDQSVS